MLMFLATLSLVFAVTQIGDPFPSTLPQSMIVGVNNLANWTYTYDEARSHITKGEFVSNPPHTIGPPGTKPPSGTYGWEIKPDKDKKVGAPLFLIDCG
jgi:hypothetical protein